MSLDQKLKFGEEEGLSSIVLNDPFALGQREKRILWSVLVLSIVGHAIFVVLIRQFPQSEHRLNSAPIALEKALQTKVYTAEELESVMRQSKTIVQSQSSSVLSKNSQEAEYWGEKTQRVLKQTRAPQFGDVKGVKSTRDSVQDFSADASKETKKSSVDLHRLGVGAWILPSVSPDQPSKKKSAEIGSQKIKGTHDLLGREVAVGSETLLNTDEYKYASFFNRLKAEVAPRWEPRIMARLQDSQLRMKSGFYRTETEFTVDGAGRVLRVDIKKASGVKLFDSDAEAALSSLPTISNLPSDLKDSDGLYRITLGFVVNVDQSHLKADYVPDRRLLRKVEK